MIKYILAIIFLPKIAYAYVDPGIIGVLFQYVFVVFFGLFLTLIVKPFKLIKSLFKKNTKNIESKNDKQ